MNMCNAMDFDSCVGASYAVISFRRARIEANGILLKDFDFMTEEKEIPHNAKLKPCKKNCDTKYTFVLSVIDSEGVVKYHVQCGSCNAATPIMREVQEAIQYWNKEMALP